MNSSGAKAVCWKEYVYYYDNLTMSLSNTKMASRQHNQFGITDTSVTANVPENDIARLMYYLNAVCYLIEYNDNSINRYRNCNNWSQLSIEEVQLLTLIYKIIKYSFILMIFVAVRRISFSKSVTLAINCWLYNRWL
jgi:hypothetical protein